MNYQVETITEDKLQDLFAIQENHFNDFKAKEISGKKLSKTVSAFANASGGEIYIGIREEADTKIKHWEGFDSIENFNSFIQILDSIPNIESYYDIDYLIYPPCGPYVMKICVFKTQSIVKATDGKIFVRRGAQSLPVDTPEKIRRLELDKGITSYENEPVGESQISDAAESEIFADFSNAIVPQAEPYSWLKKQRLIVNDKLTVAGELLFADEPQICLPKRSSIKIFRYKTSGEAD